MRALGLFGVVILLGVASARADSPPPPATEPASVAQPASASATEPARKAAAGGLTEAEVAAAFKKFRASKRDGETVYCRRQTPLGTRLATTVCYTEEQVLEAARVERDTKQMLSQQNVCGASCSPN